jgi:phosphotransferase system enzyme I (PtsI)
MPQLKGLGVSAGVARGDALVLRQRARYRYYLVPADAIDREIHRFTTARDRSRAQLEEITARVTRLAGAAPASLFEAQLLMLDDPMLVNRTSDLIREQRHNTEWALQEVGDELAATLNQADDPYLRERQGDIQDVIGRLRVNLTGDARGVATYPENTHCIIVADDLPPSIAAQLDWTRVQGFVTEVGSWTYHTAILARSLGLPAIVGVRQATKRIAPGAHLILDGTTGEVFVNVSDVAGEAVVQRETARARAVASWHTQTASRAEPITTDGVRIRLDANLDLPEDVGDAVQAGASGIGLYRSEFLLAGGSAGTAGEAAQLDAYRTLLSRMPGEVTVRTFDMRELPAGASDVPAHARLGLRALRFDTALRAQFETQITALLRASTSGQLRILLPFVAGAEDFGEARTIVSEIAARLRGEGVAVPDVPVGAMIEVPSAALTADRLAEGADFFSLGTNDLIAFTLAADRADGRPDQRHEPLHPSIGRLLRVVRRAASRHRRRLAVCGEMASDPALLLLMLGYGLTEFSMPPAVIARARHIIRHVSMEECRRLAREVAHEPPPAGRKRLEQVVQRAEETPLAEPLLGRISQ